MEEDELEKYQKLVAEISDLKHKIERYLQNNDNEIEGMTYGQAVKELSFLRNKQRMIPRIIRKRYVESKEI